MSSPQPLITSITSDDEYPVTLAPPPAVGCWIISGDLHIDVAKRPNWLHRVMMRWLFGWEWRDKA